MSRSRMALYCLVTFLVSLVAGYIAATVIFIGYMNLAGIHDQDGGGAMGIAFVVAPACALIISLVVTLIMRTRLLRRREAEAAAKHKHAA